MKYYIMTILLASLLIVSCGQKRYKLDEVSGYSFNDEEIVYSNSDGEPVNGILVSNSNQDMGAFVNGKRDGLHYLWFGGTKAEECYYSNGVKDGVLKRWWHNGRLFVEAHYKNGVQEGTYQSWTENGILLDSGVYVNGEFTGVFRKQHKKIINAGHLSLNTGKMGGLSEEYYYKNGKLIRSRKWNVYGKLTEEVNDTN